MAKGSHSKRTVTKKNNPFSGGRLGGSSSGSQPVKSMESSRRSDVPRYPNGASLNMDSLSRSSPSSARTDHRTFYDDPISVRQWAAETDPNTAANFAEYGFPEASYAADVPALNAAPQFPGSLPLSSSGVCHVSFPVTSGFPSDSQSASCAHAGPHGMTPNPRIPPNPATMAGIDLMKNYDYDTWSYPTPTAEDMAYSTATASYLPYGGGNQFEPRHLDLPSGMFLPEDEFPKADYPCGSHSVAWSPLLATDPSGSSSFSRSSYLAMQSSTPLSPVAQEPDWLSTHGFGQEEEHGLYPAFSLGEAFPIPAMCSIAQHDDMREAHGMHGHGDKPHLCTYQDCERSIPGNGFPRRWNLYDHMRRVHNHPGQASSPGSTSPTPSSTSSICPGQSTLAIRKRRTSCSSKTEAMKKTKSNSSNRTMGGASIQGHQLQSMQLVWHQQKAALNARMAALDPTDTAALERINADCAMLQTMAMDIRSQETAQLAH
ncbi:MAG: hypothetical protein Q9186_004531 [Xanthomendoza sp. 1 TL-2023]